MKKLLLLSLCSISLAYASSNVTIETLDSDYDSDKENEDPAPSYSHQASFNPYSSSQPEQYSSSISHSNQSLSQEENEKRQKMVVFHFIDYVFLSTNMSDSYKEAVENSDQAKQKLVKLVLLLHLNNKIKNIFPLLQSNSDFADILSLVDSDVKQPAILCLANAHKQNLANKRDGIQNLPNESLMGIAVNCAEIYFKKLTFIAKFNNGFKAGAKEALEMAITMYAENNNK